MVLAPKKIMENSLEKQFARNSAFFFGFLFCLPPPLGIQLFSEASF
jgi:hypothetical protein